eukprot:TRINITY_DN6820_c0_g1_i1.p1 TRINITY_DN6820_c0_g1~~TRINITY_DN6820_c0_g1_i1.p1  ORF type:complete len:519 (+),score=68.02 TRINITY_DN6820_c0_g1_i1:32-1588(+)
MNRKPINFAPTFQIDIQTPHNNSTTQHQTTTATAKEMTTTAQPQQAGQPVEGKDVKVDPAGDVVQVARKRIDEELNAHPSATYVDLKKGDVQGSEYYESVFGGGAALQGFAEKMANLNVTRVQKMQEGGADCLRLFLSTEEEEGSQEEGEERFEMHPEEEEEETGRSGRGRAGGMRGRGGRVGARLRPRPRPEGIKSPESLGSSRSFREVLEMISVQRIAYENWTRKRLVLVGKKQPLERALSRINTHNILSLPVVDEDSPNGAVIGLLDVLDIISSVSENIESSNTQRPRRNMLFTSIADVMNKEGRHPTYLTSTSTSLKDVIHQFANTGIQRVMVVERNITEGVVEQNKPEDTVVGLLTQSDLIRFIAENFMWMKREPVFSKTLRELNIGQREPITVDCSTPAYKVFLEIHKKCREGVAMVDNNGKLVANVSASNIKGMTRRNYQLLFRPIIQYLSRDRKRGWWQLPICTTLDTPLSTVVLQFVASKVHRMYIVDNDDKPVGEVSLTDVMAQLKNI